MKRPVLVLILTGTLALTGCAQADRSSASSPGCAVPSGPVVLTEAQNHTQTCVPVGTHLEIYLQGTVDDRWSQPSSDSPVLRPEPSGKGALKVGVTAGFYVADHAGRATVVSTRDGARYEITVRVV